MNKVFILLISVNLLSSCAESIKGASSIDPSGNSNLPTLAWISPSEYEDNTYLSINNIDFFKIYITFEGNSIIYKYDIENIIMEYSFNSDDEDMFIGGDNYYTFNMTTVSNGVESTKSNSASTYVSFN